MKSGMKFSAQSKSRQMRGPTSPAQIARKSLLRRIQRQELRKLQGMLPGPSRARLVATRQEEDPCAVIQSVIGYIDDLHATILARVRQGTLPPEVLSRLSLPGGNSPSRPVVTRTPPKSSSQRSS